MNSEEYIKNALKTESLDLEAIRNRFSEEKIVRGMHAAIGLVTESGELIDAFKKHLYYGKQIDWTNVGEEAGDFFWYLAVLSDVMGRERFDEMLQNNIDKLAARYPDQKFTSEAAINRDIDIEREILDAEYGNDEGQINYIA